MPDEPWTGKNRCLEPEDGKAEYPQRGYRGKIHQSLGQGRAEGEQVFQCGFFKASAHRRFRQVRKGQIPASEQVYGDAAFGGKAGDPNHRAKDGKGGPEGENEKTEKETKQKVETETSKPS